MVETTGRGTLGQQQQVMMQEQQQGRVTRSDRKKAVEEERRFETGKAEAERLRTEVFIDKNIEEQETFKYYIPNRYLDRWGNPTNAWNRLTDKQKQQKVDWYRGAKAKYGGVREFTGTRTKTTFDPFTFEEYEEEYEKLSPDVQQFFSSPVEIKAEKQRQKEVDLGLAQTKIEAWQEKIAREEERRKNQKEYWDEYTRRDSYRRLSSERKAEERARHVNRMREYDNKIDEYRASIRYLQGEWGKIGEGYKLQDLIGYAQDKAYYDWLRWDSQDNARYKFELGLAKNDESLMKNLETLGFKDKTKVSFTDYQKSADKFNKDLAYTQQLQKWAGQKGFENLPTFAQDKIRSSTGLQTGEIPTFDTRGKLTNVQSAVFGGVYSAKDYETKVVQYQQTIDQAGGIDKYNEQLRQQQYRVDIDEEEDKKVKIPFKFIDAPIGYGSGMTINAFDTGKLLVADDFGTQTSVDPNSASLKWTAGKVGQGYGWARDRIYVNPDASFGVIDPEKTKDFDFIGSPIKFGFNQEIIDARKLAVEERTQKFSDTRDNLYQLGYGTTIEKFAEDKFTETEKLKGLRDQDEIAFLKSDVGKEFYFSDFEDDQKREQAFDSAWSAYRKTDVGQKFEKQYQDEYTTEFRSQWKDFTGETPFLKRWATAGGDFVLGIGETVMKLDTPLELATAGAIAYGGITGLGALGKSAVGSKILTATSVGFTGYGLKSGFDPTKTDAERFGGFVTAGLGAFSLTKAGIKYMRTPSVERVAVGSKLTLKTQSMGYDNVKHLDKAGNVGSKVVYSEQKLSQVGVGGSRAVVSQRWRDLFNKYVAPLNKRIAIEHVGGSGMKSVLRFSIKPSTTRVASVYEGVPAWQPAQFMKVESIRGSTLVKTAPSGYEKAMKLLKDYGASDYQARATLRYYAPRVYEQWINKGVIVPSKDTAQGIFSTEVRQPKVDLGGGISTRAGKPIKDLIAFERKIIPSKQLTNVGKDAVGFSENAMRFRTIGDKPLSQFEMTSGKAIGKASEISKGQWQGFEYDWRKLGSISQQRGSLQLNFGKDSWSLGIYDQSKMSAKGSYLIDSDSFKPIGESGIGWVKPAKIKKTPFSRTFGSESTENFERVVKQIQNPTPAPKVSTTDPTPKQFQATQSEFYGQGMYEKTDGVAGKMFGGGSARNLQVMEQVWMKAPLQVDFASPKVQFGKMFEVQTMSQVGLKLGLLSQVGLLELLSQVGLRMQQKTDQKQDVQLKTLLKQKLGLKHQVALRQDTQMKQAQTTATTLQAPSLYQTPISLKDPMFRSPPPFKTPKFFLPPKKTKIDRVKSRIRQMKMQEIRFEGLLPDFTSRALGLSPKEVGGVGDAMREIRKIQTGLGIRTGARFKKSNNKRGNVSEKNLLRGIAN